MSLAVCAGITCCERADDARGAIQGPIVHADKSALLVNAAYDRAPHVVKDVEHGVLIT
jgi:hypothetical protein